MENVKNWTQTRNVNILHAFIPYFVHLGTFIVILLTGNIHVKLGCTKMRNSGIVTVLHWWAPDVHIFNTNPSLLGT